MGYLRGPILMQMSRFCRSTQNEARDYSIYTYITHCHLMRISRNWTECASPDFVEIPEYQAGLREGLGRVLAWMC